jgi:hypothetical protein
VVFYVSFTNLPQRYIEILFDVSLHAHSPNVTDSPITYTCMNDSNMTSFLRFVSKRAIYRLGIISLAPAPAKIVCDIVRKRKYKLPSSNQSILYRICTLRHNRIEIIHGSQNVF